MRLGRRGRLLLCGEHTPWEFRLGIEFKPRWVSGFGARQIVGTFSVWTWRIELIYEFSRQYDLPPVTFLDEEEG